MKIRYVTPFLFFLCLTACGAPKTADDAPPAPPDAQTDGELPEITDAKTNASDFSSAPDAQTTVTLTMRRPKTLNPLLNDDITVDRVLKLCYEPLFLITDGFEAVANLAASIETAPDGKSAVIYLNDYAQWDDGAAVTSADVIFSFDTLLSAPETSIYKHCVKNVAGVVALDNFSVRADFDTRVLMPEFTLIFPIIPKHVFAGDPDFNGITGCGAFAPTSRGYDAYVFGKKPNAQGPVERVRVLISPDAQTDLNAFNQGVADILYADYASVAKNRSAKNINLTPVNTPDFEFLGLNAESVPLQIKNVRESLLYALNMDDIINRAYLGGAKKTLSFAHPDSPFYDASLAQRPFDLTKSGDLLKEAGFINIEGVFYYHSASETKYFELNLITNAENEKRVLAAKLFAENMASIGVTVNVRAYDFAEYADALAAGAFDLALCGLRMPASFDFSFAALNDFSPIKHMFSAESEFRAYARDVFFASDPATCKRAMFSAQKFMADEIVLIPLLYENTALLTSERVIPGETLFLHDCLRFEGWRITDAGA